MTMMNVPMGIAISVVMALIFVIMSYYFHVLHLKDNQKVADKIIDYLTKASKESATQLENVSKINDHLKLKLKIKNNKKTKKTFCKKGILAKKLQRNVV